MLDIKKHPLANNETNYLKHNLIENNASSEEVNDNTDFSLGNI